MKKILALFAVTLLLFSALSFSTSAGDWVYQESQNNAVILDDGTTIVYKGESYKKIETTNAYVVSSYDEYEFLDCVFEDNKLENNFEYFEVIIPRPCDYILIVNYNTGKTYSQEYYVKVSHLESVNAFISGESGGVFVAEQPWGLPMIKLPQDIIDEKVVEENKLTFDGSDIDSMYNEWTPYGTTDEGGYLFKQEGLLLRDTDYLSGTNNYYILKFSDHTRDSFYSQGNFALGEEGVTTHLYPLGDIGIDEGWDETPEDELLWVVNDISEIITIVLCSILFGLVPLAAVVFAVLKLFVFRAKYTRRSYVCLLIAGLSVLACFAIVLIMIL